MITTKSSHSFQIHFSNRTSIKPGTKIFQHTLTKIPGFFLKIASVISQSSGIPGIRNDLNDTGP